MTTETAWELDPRRAPTLAEGEELVYCEHGRIIYRTPEKIPGQGTDCRSHWFRVVRRSGAYFLLVHHGVGEERVSLGYSYRNFTAMFDPLNSDARFWLFWTILDVHHNAQRAARDQAATEYKQAFVDGRLKKRKMPGRPDTKVWIETFNLDAARAAIRKAKAASA